MLTSRQNSEVKRLRALASQKKARDLSGQFYGDSPKLLLEAIGRRLEVTSVLGTGPRPGYLPGDVPYQETDPEIIDYISPQASPQGIVFSARIPVSAEKPTLKNAVILESIQDPGNLGTLIRTANAFGAGWVILTGSCADLWSAKTLRASMGAVFRQRTAVLTLEELSALREREGAVLLGAALSDRSRDLRLVKYESPAVCIGNEGNGLSRRLLEMCNEEIIIPMVPDCESLNASAAGAVVMWELLGRRLP